MAIQIIFTKRNSKQKINAPGPKFPENALVTTESSDDVTPASGDENFWCKHVHKRTHTHIHTHIHTYICIKQGINFHVPFQQQLIQVVQILTTNSYLFSKEIHTAIPILSST